MELNGQQQYKTIDILKFVMASLILTLHIGIPYDSPNILCIIVQYIARLGVPFSLLHHDFFIYKNICNRTIDSRIEY